MKTKILLLDGGVTVQKIVALSLDKNDYATYFATNKEEGKRIILSEKPDLVLVSDRLQGLEWSSFPKEVETWLSREEALPAMVLLASGQVENAKHYQDTLMKPFTPHDLQAMLKRVFSSSTPSESLNEVNQLFEESAEESLTASHISLVEENQAPLKSSETRNQLENLWQESGETESRPARVQNSSSSPVESISDLWGVGSPSNLSHSHPEESLSEDTSEELLSTEESVAYKSLLENQVQQKLEAQNLNEMVEKVLARLLPPLVERLVQERLDQLMAEQEQEANADLSL